MFRTWSYDISSLLKKGDNELRIVFFSPVRKGLEAMENYGLKLPAGNDQSVLGGMGTVSYTHLDVYKRQAHAPDFCQFRIFLYLDSPPLIIRQMPMKPI